MGHVSIATGVLALGSTALLYMVFAAVFASYRNGFWWASAKPLMYASISGAVFWAEFGFMLMTTRPMWVNTLSLLNLALLLIYLVMGTEAQFQIFGYRTPAWWPRLRWGVMALVPLTVAVGLWGPHYMGYRNQYGFVAMQWPTWLSLISDAVFVLGFLGYLAFSLLEVTRRRSSPRRMWYAGLIFATVPFYFSDAILSTYIHILYPVSWVSGLLWLVIFWRELNLQVRDTQLKLNIDHTTQASSRSYGELYLSTVLQYHGSGLLYLDINDFKDVNDHYGHDVGDEVLRALVQRCKQFCRQGDLIVRLGGDEFVAILPGVSEADMPNITKRWDEGLNTFPTTVGEHQEFAVTVSMGWSWASAGSDTRTEDLIKVADDHMYQAKRHYHAVRGRGH